MFLKLGIKGQTKNGWYHSPDVSTCDDYVACRIIHHPASVFSEEGLNFVFLWSLFKLDKDAKDQLK